MKTASNCGHPRAGWSATFVVRCPDCDAPMFLPPSLLALRPLEEIVAMETLWSAAGCPQWNNWTLDWNINPKFWIIYDHPLFSGLGGIPVRNDLLDVFRDAESKTEYVLSSVDDPESNFWAERAQTNQVNCEYALGTELFYEVLDEFGQDDLESRTWRDLAEGYRRLIRTYNAGGTFDELVAAFAGDSKQGE